MDGTRPTAALRRLGPTLDTAGSAPSWQHYSPIDGTDTWNEGSAATVRKTGIWVVAAFWSIQFVELTAVALMQGWDFALHRLPERFIIVGAGMVLSLLLVESAARLEGQPFRTRLIGTLLAALIMCAALMVFAYQVAKLGIWGDRQPDLVGFVYVGFAWSWFFLSVAAAILALSYSAEVTARGKRLARLEVVARDASLAALRYQINPHFLFSALNSIAGLIGMGEAEVAETMVENLADFLRATLESDPVQDISLERELEFQRLYLAIEQTRFPHRVVTAFDVPADLADLAVPALITQPLIENTILHAVARSSGLVTVRVSAAQVGTRLAIRVEDDGGIPVGDPVDGTGKGLQNVRDRLAVKYGQDQSFTAEPIPDGGFRVEIQLPLARLP